MEMTQYLGAGRPTNSAEWPGCSGRGGESHDGADSPCGGLAGSVLVKSREKADSSLDWGDETSIVRSIRFEAVHSKQKCPPPELAAGISRVSLVAFYIPGI